jgi:hypothetical protein
MTALTIAPNKFFEFAKDGVSPVQEAYVSTPVVANLVVVPAVTGKKIRVLGLIAFSNTAATLANLAFFSPIATGIANFNLMGTQETLIVPPNMLGLFESAVSQPIAINATFSALTFTIQYIVYTP